MEKELTQQIIDLICIKLETRYASRIVYASQVQNFCSQYTGIELDYDEAGLVAENYNL